MRTEIQVLNPAQFEHSIADAWRACRFLTCSVLPVSMACNLNCKFCFSKSSISTLPRDRVDWTEPQLETYMRFARSRGAYRLVITGGGEPLLRPAAVRIAVRTGRKFFREIALFTNGTFLDRALAAELAEDGLSYICFSRHHYDDAMNRGLMGEGAVNLKSFFQRIDGKLKVRPTCVMCRGFIEDASHVWQYIERLGEFGVTEFTFKHTYVAYEQSVFGKSVQNTWTEQHQVQSDPFAGCGETIATLPWGPEIKRIGELQLCYYYEPTPNWELQRQLCRSANLLADGKVYASLEDQRSLLFTLIN